MANYCLVNQNGENVTVKVTSNNGLRTGAKFWLWKQKAGVFQPIETDKHQGSTGDDGLWDFTLNLESNQLEGLVMTWILNSCLLVPEAEKASIKIELFQGNIKCKTTADIRYNSKYPGCAQGKALSQKGQISFTLINQIQVESLWTRM